MKYSELIELYKKNELPEQQREQIEYDIERQEAIAEYLFEKDETAAFELADDTDFGEADFTEKTNKSINRKFVKAGVLSAAAAVVVILFIVFALPNIVSCFYYNPAKEITSNEASVSSAAFNQMGTDLGVFTELTMPGYFRDTVNAHSNGYGSYDIEIQQWFAHSGTSFNNVSGKLVRNKLVLYDTNILKAPPQNYFAWGNLEANTDVSLRKLDAGEYPGTTEPEKPFTERETSAQILKEFLSDNKQYLGYVSLDRLMDYNDFIDFIYENEFSDVWCGVVTPRDTDFDRAGSIPKIADSYLGFICKPGASREHAVLDKYPTLFTGLDNAEALTDEDFAKQHFLSMLKYLRDNKRGFSVVSQVTSGIYDLDSAIAYVEENGLKIHGFTITATKEELLKINDMKEVYAIETQEMR